MNVDRIVRAIEEGECKEIGGLRCFVITTPAFMAILNDMENHAIFVNETLVRQHGLENFELRLSSIEEGRYYLCTKSVPILDGLWKKHFKGATE
jgi:hypothetical protein